MTKILIPHGITPTGFGVRLRTNGNLRPISKCCGRSMDGKSEDRCKGCGVHYRKQSLALGASLGNDVGVLPDDPDIIPSWIRKLTGIPHLEVKVSK